VANFIKLVLLNTNSEFAKFKFSCSFKNRPADFPRMYFFNYFSRLLPFLQTGRTKIGRTSFWKNFTLRTQTQSQARLEKCSTYFVHTLHTASSNEKTVARTPEARPKNGLAKKTVPQKIATGRRRRNDQTTLSTEISLALSPLPHTLTHTPFALTRFI
jgi:hypothetical protein